MTSEYQKMLSGEWYDANNNIELAKLRNVKQDLTFELNQLKPSESTERQEVLKKLFGKEFNRVL